MEEYVSIENINLNLSASLFECSLPDEECKYFLFFYKTSR